MIVFMLLAIFALLAILFAAVAWGANNRRRAGQKGVDPRAMAHARPTRSH